MSGIEGFLRFVLITACVVLTCAFACAQEACHDWTSQFANSGNSIGGPTPSSGDAVAFDDVGNVYMAISFTGTMDANPDTGSYMVSSYLYNSTTYRQDILIIKLDSNDQFIWAKQITGLSGTKSVTDMEVDHNGYLYISGLYQHSYVDLDPDTSEAIFNGTDMSGFLTKWTNDGTYVWGLSIASAEPPSSLWQTQRILALHVDDSSNVLITGFYQDTIDIDPDSNTAYYLYPVDDEYTDGFVIKYDSNAQLVWGFGLTSSYSVRGTDIATDGDGNVYATGGYGGSVDFDPDTSSYNLASSSGPYSDIYVLHLGPNGVFQWVKSIGGSNSDISTEIIVDENGQFALSGIYRGNVDFDPGSGWAALPPHGLGDAFIARYNAQGEYIWAKGFGGSSHDEIWETRRDMEGNHYIVGRFGDSLDFDPGIGTEIRTSQGFYDHYILKLDSNGVFEWVTTYGNNNYSYAKSVAITDDFDVYCVGRTAGQGVDFDPGIGSYILNEDGAFLHKLIQCDIQYVTDSIAACETYYWSLTNMTYQESGSYIGLAEDANGCDSIVTLELSILNSSASNDTIVACDAFTWSANAQVYTQSGTYVDTLLNQSGCDSATTINLTIHHSKDTLFTDESCQTYTWEVNGSIYTSSGQYDTLFQTLNGCDSLVTLDLTILPLDTVVQQFGAMLIAPPNLSYQWLQCDSAGYIVLIGDTFDTLVPIQNGSYAVVLGSSECIDTTSCHSIQNVGSRSHSLPGILVYPNPTRSQLFIQTRTPEKYLAEIRSATSELLITKESSERFFQINLEQLPPGLYTLRIICREEVFIRTVIKM
ncbi:MAG: T9SS type A sorting domain-containing protein [Cryomorphaceae bacterium]